MGGDHFIRHCFDSFTDLRERYRVRGFSGISHEANVLRCCQSWRLVDGAEPSRHLSGSLPASHMRYGPYQTTEAQAAAFFAQ